jgi:hypothetical protein
MQALRRFCPANTASAASILASALLLVIGSACGGACSQVGRSSSTGFRDGGTASFKEGGTGSGEKCEDPRACHPAGTLLWVRRIGGGTGNSIAGGIAAADSDGGILVSGTAAQHSAFDSRDAPRALDLPRAIMFLAKYDRQGALQWIERARGHGPIVAPRVATGTDGSAFMTGDFYPEATFEGDDGDADLQVVSSSDQAGGVFVVKYGPQGTLSWAASASGPGAETGLGVAALSDGSAVVTGFFQSRAVFGPDAGAELSARGEVDAFVARYDEGGRVAWAHAMGGPVHGDEAYAVTEVHDGGIVVAGGYTGAFAVDTADAPPIAAGVFDVFVIKYDCDGNPVWVTRAGGPERDSGRGVAPLEDGGVLVTGAFRGEASFGVAGGDAVALAAAGDGGEDGSVPPEDVFVLKLSADGAVDWAVRAGGGGNDVASAIATFPDGTFAIAGSFEDDATFGEGENQVTLTSAGRSDVFVARFDAAGSLLWAERAGGPSLDRAQAVAVAADGTLAVTGVIQGRATFGEGERAVALDAAETDSIFIARFVP